MNTQPIPLRHVANLDAHVCNLIYVLGDPQVVSRGGRLLTGWVFGYPDCNQHWAVTHLSDEPVTYDGTCARHEELCWALLGQTDDRHVIHDVVSYLYDGHEFDQQEAPLVGGNSRDDSTDSI
jgi:hypothetical protein